MKKWAALVLTAVMLLCAASALAVDLVAKNLVVTVDQAELTWEPDMQLPAITVEYKKSSTETVTLEENKDYKLTYLKGSYKEGTPVAEDPTLPSTYYVRVDGMGEYAQSVISSQWKFKVLAASLTTADITLSQDTYTYDGKAKEPAVTVKIGGKVVPEEEYTLTYAYNTDYSATRKPSVTVKSTKLHTKDSQKLEFTINQESISGAEVTLEQEVYTYDDVTRKPAVLSVVVNGRTLTTKDYSTPTYENNREAGEATVRIKAKGNYVGEVTKSFTIKPFPLENAEVTLSDANKNLAYSGNAQQPKPTVRRNGKMLKKDTHYQLHYQKDGSDELLEAATDVGSYTIVIEPLTTNYSGSNATAKFEIGSKMYAKIDTDAFIYNGKEQRPKETVSDNVDKKIILTEGTHYTISYSYTEGGAAVDSPVDAGAYTMKMTAVPDSEYGGYVSKKFTIAKRDLKDVKVVLENDSMGYTGSAIKPVVKAFDLDGNMLSVSDKDYTVETKTDVGKYTVKVTATADSVNYTGEQTAEFEIVKSAMNMEPVVPEDPQEQLKSDYTYGEDICVTVKALPAGAAPMRMMMRGPRPAQPKQMALYVKEGDGFRQISDGVDANANGEYKLVYELKNKLLLPGKHTLYAGYTGDSNTLDTMKELGEVTIHRKKLTAFAGAQSRPYSPGHTQVEILNVKLTGVEQGDDVYVVTNTGDVGSEQMGGYTKLTALPLEGQKLLQGKDAIWYSLSAAMDTAVEILPADMDSLPKTGDASMLGAWIALLGAAGMGLKLRRKQ